MLIVGFLIVIGVIGVLLYTLVIHREVPGAVEQRFGVLEALPEDLGKWVVDDQTEEGKAAVRTGVRREVRFWHDPSRDRLLKQTRYRNPATGAITRVDPEQVIKRRRVRV
jgi:hypothetical protein